MREPRPGGARPGAVWRVARPRLRDPAESSRDYAYEAATPDVADDGVPKPRGRNLVGSGNAAAAASYGEDRIASRAYIPPSRVTVGKTVGLHLSWFVYRGAGRVRFEPPQVKVWEDTRTGANSPWAPLWNPPAMPADGKVVTKATFTAPGTYVLRGVASDGSLFTYENVTIVVTK